VCVPKILGRLGVVAVAMVLTAGSTLLSVGVAGAVHNEGFAITMAGGFGGTTTSGVVVGAQESKAATGLKGVPFTFYVSCSQGGVAVKCGQVTYSFGDGKSATGGPKAVHAYTSSGLYSASASVDSIGYGEATISVVVSPYYVNERGGVVARAVWTLGALGFGSTCRGGSYCSGPAKLRTPNSLAVPLVNGITGVSCLASAGTCGLPQAAFSLSNEGASCSASCEATLQREGLVTKGASPQLVYHSLDCADGYTATRDGAKWRASVGVESGCETRMGFLSVLVALADGGTGREAPSPCRDNSNPVVREAAALGIMKPLVTRGLCYLSGPLSKLVAYQLLGALGNKKNIAVGEEFVDLAKNNLVGTVSPATAAIGGLLSSGTTLIGSDVCVNGAPRCFNGAASITGSEASSLLASVLLGDNRVEGGVGVTLSAVGSTELVAQVRGAYGEPATQVSVSFNVVGGSCTSKIVISGGQATNVTCQVRASKYPRIATARVSRGWGTANAAVYFQ
jgi:hypothetical protein